MLFYVLKNGVNIDNAEAIYRTKSSSSVKIEASIALKRCLNKICEKFSENILKISYFQASSSAAGELRMIVIGVTERLS